MPQGITQAFTGLEGVATPEQLAEARRKRALEPSAEDAQSEAIDAQEALGQAQQQQQAENYEGVSAPFDRRLAITAAAISNLEERGLGAHADTLRANMVQLRKQKQAQAAEAAKLSVSAPALPDVGVSALEARVKGGRSIGQEDLSKTQSRIATLDATDPEQAKLIDQANDRLTALTAKLGKDKLPGPDKVGFRASLSDLEEARAGIDRLEGIAESFDPEFLTAQGKAKNFALGIADMLQIPMSDSDRESLIRYRQFTTRTIQNLNLYIRDITGAQMGENEADRLMKGLPNDNDSPVEFETKLRLTLDEMEAGFRLVQSVAMADASGDSVARVAARSKSRASFLKEIKAERMSNDDIIGSILGGN